ncbi:hypothetical protein [Streptomyces lydicus]|uniref:hypothetical protein n=1 Tax=Streptomyces lydicus TaxID=47763 RepID=UPI0036E53094
MASLKKRAEALYQSGGEVKAGKVVEEREGNALIEKPDGKYIIRRDEEIVQLEG